MKKIILLSLLFVTGTSFAQTSPINFEEGGNGADFSWLTFDAPEGFENPTFTIEPNPATTGVNTSSTAAKLDISYPSQEPWGQAGCETDIAGNDMGIFSFDETNSIVTIMVYQEGFASQVALKFVNSTFGAEFETIVENTVVDEWVELTFDMSGLIGSGVAPFSRLTFFASYGPRETGHVVWFDNVEFGDGSTVSTKDILAEGITTFPNPTTDNWTVASELSPITEVRLFDIAGKVIFSINPNADLVQISADALSEGIYLAEIRTAMGSRTVRLVKN